MRRIKAFFKLTRPVTTLTGALAVLLGGYVAGTGAWLQIGLAVAATLLISAAANAWNDYLDIDIDRVNQPQRVLPSGQLSPREAWIFSLVLTVGALLLAALISWPAFLIALFSTAVLYIYSWKLKSTVLMGNATVAGVAALSAVFGGVAAGNALPTIWLALIIATSIMGREILKTLADYEGDLREHCQTISTAWGKRPARLFIYVFLVASLVMMMIPYLIGDYNELYAYVVAIGVFPVMLYIMLRVNWDSSARQLQHLSQLMKYDFFVWFIAVVLGTAT